MSNLNEVIISAVDKVRESVRPLMIEAKLLKSTPTYDVATGVKSELLSETPIDALIDKFQYNEIDNNLVLYTDIKLIVFADLGVEPTLADKIRIKTFEYKIMSSIPTYVKDEVAVYTLQLRL